MTTGGAIASFKSDTYDAVGNRNSLADDAGLAGAITGFGHDGAGRLTQLTTPTGQSIDLAYDPAGRLTGLTFPNTVSSALQYDMATGRLSQVTHAAGAVQLADLVYGYNGVGNIASIAELTQTRNFSYDELQRLTAGGTAATPESYSYDPEGNRTASHLSVSHTTDAANRLTEDDAFCYAYELNGNLETKTAKVAGTCTGGVTTYSYDAQDQLIRIDFPDLTFAAYRYGGLGRRIEKDVNGAITRYVYDRSDILLEFDGLENLRARYSHGLRIDQPLAVARDLDSSGTFEAGEQFYYQADHQGSLRKITDSVGTIVNSYDYDSYGRIEASTEAIANPFTYTGREIDAESGLYYYRARYYDPATGRFLQEDPLGFAARDLNLYRYVFNNPVNLTDPSGLESCKNEDDHENIVKWCLKELGKALYTSLFCLNLILGNPETDLSPPPPPIVEVKPPKDDESDNGDKGDGNEQQSSIPELFPDIIFGPVGPIFHPDVIGDAIDAINESLKGYKPNQGPPGGVVPVIIMTPAGPVMVPM